MATVSPVYTARSVEAEVLSLWRARHLPPAGGVLGPPTGPAVRQFEGAWTQGDFPSLVAHRAVTADVDARYLALVGRRAVGTLRQGVSPGVASPTAVPALLTALGVWTGGDGSQPWDSEDRTAGVQAIVGRLASQRILVTRDESFRVCPTCGSPRSPERIVYDEQEGDTFLVRFPVRVDERAVSALVWVDAPWKLLGTSAILVNPDLRYVIATYHRREVEELVLTSESSLARLRSWIPEAILEIVEEHPGRRFQGVAYSYPLRHEFPMGGDLVAPAGTILSVPDVGDSGTGVVPLVPGHGPTDAQIAARFGVTGWPLITPKGKLDFTLMHKYAGLDLTTADEFVLRDLSEAGALLARLRVKRGVPHCALCGTPLLWTPGRAWCLEPSHLTAERRALFARLLPKESLPGQVEVAPWPVSEATASDEAGSVALLECTRCDRLAGPDGPAVCPCGGQRSLVRRRLLPSTGAAFAAWARFDPFPDGDSVNIYVGHRRRVPALVNHLAALSGVQGAIGDVNLTVVPTVAAAEAPELAATYGADAVRGALIHSGLAESSGSRFAERCRQEADRIGRWCAIFRAVVGMCDPSMLAAFARPIGGFLTELEIEDRIILARWERTRVLALAHYDHWAPGLVYRRAFRFLDNDMVEYRALVQPRLALAGTPSTKRAALRTLAHLLRGLSEVLAPILPFTSEAIHRGLSSERTSLFEQPMAGLDRTLLNDELVATWDRWRTVLRSVDRFRRSLGVARTTMLPSVVLVLPADDLADRFRTEKETLARLARVERIDIASPKEPWTGRHREIRPIEPEIQKAYPSQASQIIHLLQRMPPRRWEAALGQEDLTVVINGLPRRVFPAMVEFSDTLPERVVPFPWSLGEMYVERPSGAEFVRPPMPPLSSDAFWLVRRVERRLRAAPAVSGSVPRVAIVTAKNPLASELRAFAEPIGRYLALTELRVVERSEELVPPNALTGRTRTGDRWWVHVPDLPATKRRAKPPRVGDRLQRVSVVATSATEEVDFADEQVVAREEAVRALGQELDTIIGIPLLSPAKISIAWDQGVHSVEDLRQCSFETVAALPGFGGAVAEMVVERLGGTVPPRSRRARRGAPVGRPPTLSIPRMVAASEAPAPPAPLVPSSGSNAAIAAVGPSSLPADGRPTPQPIEDAEPPAEPTLAPISPDAEPMAPVPSVPEESLTDHTGETSPQPPDVVPAVSDSSAETALPEEALPEAPPVPSAERAPSDGGTAPETPVSSEISSTLEEVNLPTESPSPPDIPVPEGSGPPPETSAAPAAGEPKPLLEAGPLSPAAPSNVEGVVSGGIESTASEPAPPEAPEPPPAVEIPGELPVPTPELTDLTRSFETPTSREQVAESSAPEPEPSTGAEPPSPETEGPVAPVSPEVPAAQAPEPTSTEPVGVSPQDLGKGVTVVPEEPTVEPSFQSGGRSESPPPPEPELPAAEVASPLQPPIEVAPSTPLTEEPVVPPAADQETSGEATPSTEVVDAPPKTDVEPVELGPMPVMEPLPALTLSEISLPPTVEPPPEPEPPPAGVELTIGDSLIASLGGFLESTAAGHHGVCVVRESPERIRARVGSRPIEVFWLSNVGRGPALRPSDLEGAFAFLSRKLLEERVTAFFFEGIEYLVRLHGADAVLNGLVEFDRLARENDARIWVCLAPALMKSSDLERFQATFGAGRSSS